MCKANLSDFYRTQKRVLDSILLGDHESEEWVLERINGTIEHALAHSPFYAGRPGYHQVGLLSELDGLPFTERQHIKDAYPFGFLAAGRESLIRYAESTGSTGKVSAGYVTATDWIENNLILFLGWSQILEPTDVLMVAIPYELTFVGADIDRVAEFCGATIIARGTNKTICNWEHTVAMMHDLPVSAIVSSPTRLLRLADRAVEMGLDPVRDFSLKKAVCVGEPLHDGKRTRIEETWGIPVYTTYGMTEATSVASPCAFRKLHLCERRYYCEVVATDTMKPLSDGEIGELTITSLSNLAMPLIRFRTGDLVRISTNRCSCFLPYRTIEHFGRVDDRIDYGGRTLRYCDLESCLLAHDEVDIYYEIAYRDSNLEIAIVPKRGFSWENACRRVKDSFRRLFGVQVTIKMADRDALVNRIDDSQKPGRVLIGDDIPPEALPGPISSQVEGGICYQDRGDPDQMATRGGTKL